MRALSLVPIVLIAIAACDATKADEGLDSQMRVEGAQFFRGPMPEDPDGPTVEAVTLGTISIRAGAVNKPMSGAVAPDASAAAIALAGDLGYWIVPARVPDVLAPLNPAFKAQLSFSRALAPGPHQLIVRAVDPTGKFGAAAVRDLSADMPTVPEGLLVVALRWDADADLDLHVVDADGTEISKGNINSFERPPPGQPVDPNAWKTGALLDIDSNAACVIDGKRAENVVWTMPAPPGHYLVRVDTASMCKEIAAHWTVEALASGVSLGRAQGTSFENDTRLAHDRGAGVLAMEFDVP